MGIGRARRFGNGSKRRRGAAFIFNLIALMAAGALCLSYLSLFFNPGKFPLMLFFGLYFIPLLLLNLLLLFIALARMKLSMFIPFIALLPSLLIIDRFVRTGNDEMPMQGEGVQILSYNLGRYSGSMRYSEEESAAGIRQFLAGRDADIVCLQEFEIKDLEEINSKLPGYPYMAHHLFKGNTLFGNLILSKYPIENTETLTFSESRNLILISDVNIDGKKLRIYNCHLESYNISFTALVKRLFRKESFTDEVAQVHGRLRDATLRRAAQVEALLQSESESPFPNIVCGDFNDNPVSYTYQTLSKTKKDSFVESGKGFGATYSLLWPLLRLDYVLFPQEYLCGRHETIREHWSDHYPVAAVIYPATSSESNN